MTKENNDNLALNQTIIQLIEGKRPSNVQELISLLKEEIAIPESKILDRIVRLQSQGRIMLKPAPPTRSQKLGVYLKTKKAHWYWLTLTLAAMTTLVALTIPENLYPIVYIRYMLGTLFLIWLPGYSFMKALFPMDPPLKATSRNLDSIERFALSVGISLSLVSIIGLLLNYTSWGIRLTPLALSLLTLTVVFATAGIVRESARSRQSVSLEEKSMKAYKGVPNLDVSEELS